jgi:hypothetical protein
MNPDKLFDYLDGKLSPDERVALEERFISEPELRKELAVARQIHAQMHASMEVIGVAQPTMEQRGAVLARRIGIIFTVLVFVNVLFGIYAIAFMNKKQRPPTTQEQNRNDFAESLARTAAVALPTPSLDVVETKFTASVPEQDKLANKIIAAAKRAGGSAAKGLADQQGVLLFAEIPAARVNEFREAMKKLGGTIPEADASSPGEKSILQVRISSPQ